jgi:hypothetical protein
MKIYPRSTMIIIVMKIMIPKIRMIMIKTIVTIIIKIIVKLMMIIVMLRTIKMEGYSRNQRLLLTKGFSAYFGGLNRVSHLNPSCCKHFTNSSFPCLQY